MVYGEPRLTHDVAIVIELRVAASDRVRALFGEDEFYCPPEDAIRVEAARPARGHFNVIHYPTGFKAAFYLVGQDPLHRWAMARRVAVEVEGTNVWIAPPEYVIVRKLEYYREGGSEKHLRDIAAMLQASSAQIDLETIEVKARLLGLEGEWAAAKRAAETE